jgi:hypothetical protein
LEEGLVTFGFGVQTLDHNPVDEVIHYGCDAAYSAESIVEARQNA